MSTSAATGDSHDDARHPRTITVTVNNQRVELPERQMTGLEIKQAAVAQGIEVEISFQLSVKRGHRYEVVGDTDTITVHEREEFLIVAPDDNS
jgi:hypothetical protein